MGLKCSACIWYLTAGVGAYCMFAVINPVENETVCKGILLFVSYTFKAIDLPENGLLVGVFFHF